MVRRSSVVSLFSFTSADFLSLDFSKKKCFSCTYTEYKMRHDVYILHEYNKGDLPCLSGMCNNSVSYKINDLYLQLEWYYYLCILDCNAEPNQYESRESGHCDNTCSNTTVHHRTWRGGEPNRSGIFCKYIKWNRYLDAYRIATRILYFNWFFTI